MAKTDPDICRTPCEPSEVLARTGVWMASDQQTREMADAFKLLGDFNRLRILQALAFGEHCVCDLSAMLELSQSAVSHQLRLLRTAKLVRSRKAGKNVFYALDDDHVRTLLEVSLAHIRGECHAQGEEP